MHCSRSFYVSSLTVLAASGFAAACSVPDQTAPRRAEVPVAATVAIASDVRPGEERFAQMTKEVPGFGGYYYDDAGNLVTYLTSGASEQLARTALASVLRDLPPQHGTGAIVFRHADYSFDQLARWRDQVSNDFLGAVPGILSVDADEVRNRVAIGLADLGSQLALAADLARVGIPVTALVFDKTSPVFTQDTLLLPPPSPVPQVNPPPGTTLQSYLEPAPGGAQIAFTTPNVPPGYEDICTIGYPVRSSSVVAYRGDSVFFTTASHCSQLQFESDGVAYYQPDLNFDGTHPEYYMGNEAYDPHYFICCVAHYKTRWSDALLADLRGTRNLFLGRVAKTTSYSTGRTAGQPGSITIDQNDPYFYIVSQETSVPVGYTVDKMGRTTGWTRGQVNATCVDRWDANAGYKWLCNTYALYWSDNGDSGAPIFIELGGNQIAAVGTHWGAFGSNGGRDGSAMFSPLGNIERTDEIGPLTLP